MVAVAYRIGVVYGRFIGIIRAFTGGKLVDIVWQASGCVTGHDDRPCDGRERA